MTIGERVKILRETERISLRSLSEITGLSKTTINDLENGNKKPSFETVEKIAKAFNLTTAEFLSETDSSEALLVPNEHSPEFLLKIKEYKKAENKFIEIVTPKLIKDGWNVELCKNTYPGDVLAIKDNIYWYIKFKHFFKQDETKNLEDIMQETDYLLHSYGRIAIFDAPISKFTLAFSSERTFRSLIRFTPRHLNIDISLMFIDFESHCIASEQDLIIQS